MQNNPPIYLFDFYLCENYFCYCRCVTCIYEGTTYRVLSVVFSWQSIILFCDVTLFFIFISETAEEGSKYLDKVDLDSNDSSLEDEEEEDGETEQPGESDQKDTGTSLMTDLISYWLW